MLYVVAQRNDRKREIERNSKWYARGSVLRCCGKTIFRYKLKSTIQNGMFYREYLPKYIISGDLYIETIEALNWNT